MLYLAGVQAAQGVWMDGVGKHRSPESRLAPPEPNIRAERGKSGTEESIEGIPFLIRRDPTSMLSGIGSAGGGLS